MRFLTGALPFPIIIETEYGIRHIEEAKGLMFWLPWIGHHFIGMFYYDEWAEFTVCRIGEPK